MSRGARSRQISDFYHIMVQGDEKKFIFEKNEYKDKYIYLLKRNAFRNDVYVIAYCVMDNHVHILVHSKEKERISKMMLQCGTSYGLFFSKDRRRIGHVFRDRYKSEPICDQEHLLNCIRYIHENPVKACVVGNCSQYAHSSYNDFVKKTEMYEVLKVLCDLERKDYEDIITNTHTEVEYMEVEGDFEDIDVVFKKIELKYDLNNLKKEDIVEIYYELKEKCNTSKSMVARLLDVGRNRLTRLIKNYL